MIECNFQGWTLRDLPLPTCLETFFSYTLSFLSSCSKTFTRKQQNCSCPLLSCHLMHSTYHQPWKSTNLDFPAQLILQMIAAPIITHGLGKRSGWALSTHKVVTDNKMLAILHHLFGSHLSYPGDWNTSPSALCFSGKLHPSYLLITSPSPTTSFV